MDKVEKFDSFGFVKKLKEEGRVRHIGFSFHDGAENARPPARGAP